MGRGEERRQSKWQTCGIDDKERNGQNAMQPDRWASKR